MKTDTLFQKFRAGNLELKNRVVMTAVKLGYATKEGNVTDRHIYFYKRRARGGVGLIITEPMYIHRMGREIPTQLGIYDDSLIPGMKKLTEAVHEEGCLIIAHINHAGRAVHPALVPEGSRVSASDVICPANRIVPRALTLEEVNEHIDYFVDAAQRALEAGFDGIEIPFSHGYLIHQFLSPKTNLRTDDYGGSFDNRIRFGREILEKTRKVVGQNFTIIVRMNAEDHVEGGMTLDDAMNVAKILEETGADIISISSGTMCESVPFCLYPAGTPKARLLPMSAKIKAAVSIPVIVAGRIRTPEIAKTAIAEKQTDLIGLGRPFLADPDWVIKAEEGNDKAILLCAACHQGCLGELRKGHGSGCLVNPFTGFEEKYEIVPAEKKKNVMVVGGGPAGLEAAFIASSRGHHVSLYEKNNKLGGQFSLASVPPHKEELRDTVDFMEYQVKSTNVDIHLQTEITVDDILKQKPDVIIIATGGKPLLIDFPGMDKSNWLTSESVLTGKSEVETDSACVLGGGMVGLETADFLAEKGIEVTVVEMLDEMGGDLDPLPKAMIINRLKKNGVKLLTGRKVTAMSEYSITVEHQGHKETIPVETVIMSLGVQPENALADAIKNIRYENTAPDIFIIGDASKPGKALEAIRDGLESAIEI